MRSAKRLAFVMMTSGVLASCSDITGPESDRPASVEIIPIDRVESINEEVVFTARVYDRVGREVNNIGLTWEVSDGNVLEEIRPGVYRSTGNGVATVRVRAPSGSSSVGPDGGYLSGTGPRGEVAIEVQQTAARVNLNVDTMQLWAIQQERDLDAVVVDALGTPMLESPAITWSSQENDVVSIDEEGRVRAISDGTTTILAQVGGVSGSAAVGVTATIPYKACFSFALGGEGLGDPERDCATFNITVRERE